MKSGWGGLKMDISIELIFKRKFPIGLISGSLIGKPLNFNVIFQEQLKKIQI